VTVFQQIALLTTAVWATAIVVRFRRSAIAVIGGLGAIGVFTLVSLFVGLVTPADLGLGRPESWWYTLGLAAAWLVVMLAYSPVADWLATRVVNRLPNLAAFRAIQRSRVALIAGIVVAWVLGGFLEELVARGIVLNAVDEWLAARMPALIGTAIAISVSAIGAGLLHLYQGPRAVLIVTQLSVLFGLLFVVSGYNLWAVVCCHGLYDTIALVRFARKKSKYSDLERPAEVEYGSIGRAAEEL
jgi:membrane protease YdiL (CAAX protease family)